MPCVWFFMYLGIYTYIRMSIHTELKYEFIFAQGWSLLLVSLRRLSIPKITTRNQERREREKTFNFHLKKLLLIDRASLPQNLPGERGKKTLAVASLAQLQT